MPIRADAERARGLAVLGERPGHGALALELSPTDRMAVAFLAALAVPAALARPVLGAALVEIGLLATAIVVVAWLATRTRLGRLAHDFSPIALVAAIFNANAPIIPAVNPLLGDPLLAALDDRLFPGVAAAWRGALGRPDWLTDAAALAYVSFYFLPILLAVPLYLRDRRAFRAFAFDVQATFLVSYIGYFLLPAAGPRVPRDLELAVLGGGGATRLVFTFLHAVEENVLDAFPSGHTAASLVVVALAWRLFPRWRAPLVFAAGGIVFATVYLSLHYVIDIVAGALLACTMPVLLPALRAVFHAPALESNGHRPRIGW